MPSDAYVQIRQRTEKIIVEARKFAAEQNARLEDQFNKQPLSLQEQLDDLNTKKQTITKNIAELKDKEYYRLAQHGHLIAVLYFSRLTGLNKDDEKSVREGIILYERETFIDHLLLMTKKKSKAVTFESFLAGEVNGWPDLLDGRLPEENETELDKIRAWQTKHKISCIKSEFGKFRDQFKRAVKDEIYFKETVLGELRLVEDIFENAWRWKASVLIGKLQQLKGMSGISMPEDTAEFHRLFVLFLQGDNMARVLTPSYMDRATQNIASARVSGMPVFCLSLMMYCRWLHHILLFKSDTFDKEEACFYDLFVKTCQEGDKKKEAAIDRLMKNSPAKSLKGRHYEVALLMEMEKQRKKFNNLEYPHYLYFLEKKERLKDCFINDCLRCLNMVLPKEELKGSMELNENIDFISDELCLLKHNPLAPPAKRLKEEAVLLEMICHMAPDSELINSFLDCKDLIREQISNDRIPIYFINENANCLFPILFKNAIDHFKKVLEKMNIVEKGCLIADLLRNIKYLKNSNKMKFKNRNAFYKQLIRMLKNELKSAEIIYNFRATGNGEKEIKRKTKVPKTLSFDYNPGPKPLKPILKALVLKVNLLRNGSTVDELMSVLTCKDLSKIKFKIYIGCQTNFFYYIHEKLTPWLGSFTPAQIGKSGIFVTCTDEPMSANNLYNSKVILWEDSQYIDSIFDAIYE